AALAGDRVAAGALLVAKQPFASFRCARDDLCGVTARVLGGRRDVRDDVDELVSLEGRTLDALRLHRLCHVIAVLPHPAPNQDRRVDRLEGIEGRTEAGRLAADRVALDAALGREQLLARLRVAELIPVLRREDKRQDVRELQRRERGPLDTLLAHLRAHQRQVIPHRGAEIVKAGAARDTRQVRRRAPFAAAPDAVALAAALLGIDIPAGEQRPVWRERKRGLRRGRLLGRGRRDREEDETTDRCRVASAPLQSGHSESLLRIFPSHVLRPNTLAAAPPPCRTPFSSAPALARL